jgi:HlyD family secretion protein
MSPKIKRTLALVAAILVVGGIVGFNVAREHRRRVTVQTGKVERRDLVQVVTASGEVRPRRYVNVGANVSGRIVELAVREGDSVKKGQVLARIESERYEAGARQSEAGVAAARAELERAIADVEVARLAFERVKQMHADRLISDQETDQAEAEFKMKTASVEAARRRVAQLQAQLDSTRDELFKTTVYSPMSGVVTSLPKEAGEMVIGAMSFNPTVLMTVGDLSIMECEVMVDETDIRDLALGQVAEVRVDALEGVEIAGEITEIGASAIVRGSGSSTNPTQTQLGSNTGNQPKDFKVKITLREPPQSLRPGLNAAADITTARRGAVLAVPVQAVVVRELGEDGKVIEPEEREGERRGNTETTVAGAKGEETDGVFVVEKDKVRFTPVKTGILGESEIEILEGLEPGQEIVVGSYKTLRTLKDQAKVKVDRKKGKAS